MKNLIVTLALIGALVACGSPVPTGSTVIEIDDGFIVKPFAGRDMTGGGMVVSVTGETTLTLVGAESDAADRIEFHTMGMEDGRMMMRQVTGFEVTSETPLVLERGGAHMMLFGLDSGLAIGDEIDVVLKFDDGQGKEQYVVAKVDVIGQDE